MGLFFWKVLMSASYQADIHFICLWWESKPELLAFLSGHSTINFHPQPSLVILLIIPCLPEAQMYAPSAIFPLACGNCLIASLFTVCYIICVFPHGLCRTYREWINEELENFYLYNVEWGVIFPHLSWLGMDFLWHFIAYYQSCFYFTFSPRICERQLIRLSYWLKLHILVFNIVTFTVYINKLHGILEVDKMFVFISLFL